MKWHADLPLGVAIFLYACQNILSFTGLIAHIPCKLRFK
jgi:hypothetical protein